MSQQQIILIGTNIGHSLSPLLHGTLMRRHDVSMTYGLSPTSDADIVDTIARLRNGNYRGANITAPFKTAVMPLLDEISEEASAIGAVNTIVVDNGKLSGHNTDAMGFSASLHLHNIVDNTFTAAILGAGGASRAATHMLLREQNLSELTVYSREIEQADAEAMRWNDTRVISGALDNFSAADLVVQATPVGMAGNSYVLLDEEQLLGVKLFFDMVYIPAETPTMVVARRTGANVVGGMEMFIYQAIAGFKLWTGIDVPFEEAAEIIESESFD